MTEGHPPQDLLFTSPQGDVLRSGNFAKRVLRPAAARAGVADLRIHDLRHTAASLAISAGANVKALQRMLGHESASLTFKVAKLQDGAYGFVCTFPGHGAMMRGTLVLK